MNSTPPILSESLGGVSSGDGYDDEKISHRNRTVIAVSVVSVVCVLANIFMPWFFWDALPKYIFVVMFAVGGIAAQIGALSIWAGMGGQPLRIRLLYTSFLVAVVCGSYIWGLQLPEFPNPGLPRIVAYIILGIGVGGFAIGTGAFLAMALATKTQITHRSSQVNSKHHNSISIAYVISITTVVAILVAMVPKILPSRDESVSQDEVVVIGLMCAQHVVFSLATLILSTWAVLSTKRNVFYVCMLIGMVPLLGAANILLLGNYRQVHLDVELVAALAGFTLGFAVFVNMMLGTFRLLGYRIQPNV